MFYLKNSNDQSPADLQFAYGLSGDQPVTSDWNNDGIDTVGVYRNGTFYLRKANTVGNADLSFALGNPGDLPIAGNWDATRSETLTFTYDDLDRLLSASEPYSKSYTYNTIGNITTGGATYTYGDTAHKHAVTALSTGESYVYDANGNTLAPDASAGVITRVEGGSTYTQTFDAENRLISVTVSGQTTQFIYDGDGNLVKKIKPDGSKTLYVGGVYEVDKAPGGSTTRTMTYYPAAGAMRKGVL